MLKWISLLLLLMIPNLATAEICTFSWPAVTKYTNGDTITDVVTYRIYYQKGAGPATLFLATTQISATAECLDGQYTISAVTNKSIESTRSDPIVLPKPAKVSNPKRSVQ